MSPASQAGDIVLVSSLGGPTDTGSYGSIQAADRSQGTDSFAIGQEFTSAISISLSKIVVSLGGFDTGPNSDFAFGAALYADNGGSPTGTLLSTFTFNPGTIPAVPSDQFADITFSPGSSVSLAAGTGYWFVLYPSSSNGGQVNWQIVNDPNYTLQGAGTLPGYSQKVNSNPWDAISTPPDFPPYLIGVYGSAVPEPSSWVMGSIGCAFLGLSRWLIHRLRVRDVALGFGGSCLTTEHDIDRGTIRSMTVE